MALGCHADEGFWPALGSIPSQTNCCPTRKAAEALFALAVLVLFGMTGYFNSYPVTSTHPIRKPFYSHLSDRSQPTVLTTNIL